MSSVADKSVLITGASSGIGAYLARELARRGARLGLLARREDRLRELADELENGGATVAWATADVTDGEGLAHALDDLDADLGGTDVVVANAGYGVPEVPRRFEPGVAIAMYDVNLFGMLRVIDWALPRFLAEGSGHIVGISSVASFFGIPRNASYSGSKAAMRVHLQSLRMSLAPHGIAVTTICPGFVKSELTAPAKFPMPFLWETDRAARLIADAIEKRRGEVVFPWQMRWLKQLFVRAMPVAALEWLAEVRPAKKRPEGSGQA
ncbi:MAG: SDR family NAD(P)-dependent oxidoreductase [bacterium]|nr:SDR family NAD(P)-dependent oxidoreductase [bacterium]